MSKYYLRSLFIKSSHIQKQIDSELVRPLPDSIRLLRLKKIRLAIKDKIQKIIYKPNNKNARRNKHTLKTV